MPPSDFVKLLLAPRTPAQRRAAAARRKGRKARKASGHKAHRRMRRPSARSQSKEVKNFAETQINPLRTLNNQAPDRSYSSVGNNSKIFRQYYDLSNAAPTPFGTNLNGFALAQGVTAKTRTGDYIYGKKVLFNLQIQMSAVSEQVDARLHLPIRFMVLLIRNRRENSPYGTYQDPDKALFLQSDGTKTGAGMPDTGIAVPQNMSLQDFYSSPINKKNFIVYSKKVFTLSPPPLLEATTSAEVVQSVKQYPNIKSLSMKCPVWKKVHYPPAVPPATLSNPDDYDSHFKVIIYSMPTCTSSTDANYWTSSIKGSFLYNDV